MAGTGTGAVGQPAPRPPQTRRVLASATLAMEALVVFFATLVAKDLSGLRPGVALTIGLALALGCLAVAGSLRTRWGYLAGSLLQVLIVAAGLVVTVMWLVGPIFAALWVAALHFGAKAQRIVAARLATEAAQRGDQPEPRAERGDQPQPPAQ